MTRAIRGGADAQTFAGNPPAYYTNIPGRLGYTLLNKAGDGMMSPTEGVDIFYTYSPTGRIGFRPDGVNGSAIRVGGTGAKAGFLRILGPGDVEVLSISATALLIMGQTVWYSGNDGSGSGLDADLLRGLTPDQVVSLARVLAALGYAPANAAGQTFSGDIKVSRTGANARILLENGTSGKRASLAMQTDDNLALYLTEADGDHPIFSIRSAASPLNFFTPIQVGGQTVWHSGNDGSGSGSDADTVDGHHASEFMYNAADYWIPDRNGVPRLWFSSSNGNTHIKSNGCPSSKHLAQIWRGGNGEQASSGVCF